MLDLKTGVLTKLLDGNHLVSFFIIMLFDLQ